MSGTAPLRVGGKSGGLVRATAHARSARRRMTLAGFHALSGSTSQSRPGCSVILARPCRCFVSWSSRSGDDC
jgi:hypothetical protein